jgi:hypothetical protein
VFVCLGPLCTDQVPPVPATEVYRIGQIHNGSDPDDGLRRSWAPCWQNDPSWLAVSDRTECSKCNPINSNQRALQPFLSLVVSDTKQSSWDLSINRGIDPVLNPLPRCQLSFPASLLADLL